jgi:hypothetical protein
MYRFLLQVVPQVHVSLFLTNKKPAVNNTAGFTIRSLMPLVTTLGDQFIASVFSLRNIPPRQG